MIKSLKKRFVVTAMLAITLLLVVLLGIINIANALYADAESDKLLSILSEPPGMPHHRIPQNTPRPDHNRKFLTPPEMSDNARLAAIHFTVKQSSNNSDCEVDLSRISTVSEDEAKALFKKALSENSDSGKIDTFKYKKVFADDGEISYIFLDTTTQKHMVLRVLVFSCLAGVTVWLIMLLIVILLSRRAIHPMAKNIEKQKQFVTDAGHEIKTPLAIILANTEALELHTGESRWSNNIKEQISRLNGLMQNLLTLAKSDEGNINVPASFFSLTQLLNESVDMFREPASLRKISFDCGITDNVFITSNRENIMRIISILLDNAVKYAKQGSTVNVSLNQTEKSREISIENECETLPACEPEKLFDRFYREDSARTQKSGGYGIGLSAAQALVSLCGGTLQAKYEGSNSIIFKIIL
ncbi:MAG: HAMP domain-containing histidine kinase [Ruminococcaceae bacterium]|nr:HAMP domain-containing histidine kinase [Oscillospiraceae bacterium]